MIIIFESRVLPMYSELLLAELTDGTEVVPTAAADESHSDAATTQKPQEAVPPQTTPKESPYQFATRELGNVATEKNNLLNSEAGKALSKAGYFTREWNPFSDEFHTRRQLDALNDREDELRAIQNGDTPGGSTLKGIALGAAGAGAYAISNKAYPGWAGRTWGKIVSLKPRKPEEININYNYRDWSTT